MPSIKSAYLNNSAQEGKRADHAEASNKDKQCMTFTSPYTPEPNPYTGRFLSPGVANKKGNFRRCTSAHQMSFLLLINITSVSGMTVCINMTNEFEYGFTITCTETKWHLTLRGSLNYVMYQGFLIHLVIHRSLLKITAL